MLARLLTDASKIGIRKPLTLYNQNETIDKHIYRLHIDGEPIVFQTNQHHLQYQAIHDYHNNASISLFSKEDKIYDFEHLSKKEMDVYKRVKLTDTNKSQISSLNMIRRSLRLRNKREHVKCYDEAGADIDIMTIPQYSVLRVMFSMDNIWVTNTCFGISYTLLKVKIYGQYITPSLLRFSDEEQPSSLTASQKEMYAKMVRMGIPRDGVRQKMRIEGHDDKSIDIFFTIESTKKSIDNMGQGIPLPPPIPPPPPFPPPPPPTFKLKNPMSGVLESIKNNAFKLKQVPVNDGNGLRKSNETRQSSEASQRQAPPSLHDILSAKGKLKSPNKVYHAHLIYQHKK